MRIAYVTIGDARDVNSWSGLSKYIAMALERCGVDLLFVGGLKRRRRVLTRLKEIYYRRIAKREFHREREPWVAEGYSRQVEKVLRLTAVDAVFSPGTLAIARLRTRLPTVVWTDATFSCLAGFYPGFRNLCAETLRDGNRLEHDALSRCKLAIYSSDWAAGAAIRHYGVDPKRVHVIPFGANLDCERSRDEIASSVRERRRDECQLLFIGVHWVRKGGDLAVDVARALILQGIPTRLHVVGCKPEVENESFIEAHGNLAKDSVAGRARLEALYEAAHFLILPTRADCVPVVFAEAYSRGVPCLSADVGGVRSVVRDGATGRVFAPTASAQMWADAVAELWWDTNAYVQLAMTSFDEYTRRLNWRVAGERAVGLIESVIEHG